MTGKVDRWVRLEQPRLGDLVLDPQLVDLDLLDRPTRAPQDDRAEALGAFCVEAPTR